MDNNHDVYICYSQKDYVDEHGNIIKGNEVAKIVRTLTDAGMTVWMEKKVVETEENCAEQKLKLIKGCKVFVYISSEEANQSDWTVKEVACALMYKKHVIPIMLDDYPFHDSIIMKIVGLKRIDYYYNREQGLDDLIHIINDYLSKEENKESQKVESRSSNLENKVQKQQRKRKKVTYEPQQIAPNSMVHLESRKVEKTIKLTYKTECYRLFKFDLFPYRTTDEYRTITTLENQFVYDVQSSVYSPAEVKRGFHMLVQVFIHLYEETEKVRRCAQESQKDATRRCYIPLQCELKKGDIVGVLLNINGKNLLMSEQKRVVWKGSFTKCSFDYLVPLNIDEDQLSCSIMLVVNSIPVGEMLFTTDIVENPKQLNTEIFCHRYKKIFVSYAHKDVSKVQPFHEGLKISGVEHFFDREYLMTGDIFPQIIQDYINTADLFVLFWSENASKSEYVQKERLQALKRAFPQVQPEKAAKLRIYPMSIEPRAELPADMKDNYHFGEI